MNLIVDIGNSFAKLAVFQNDELVGKWVVESDKLHEKIFEIFSNGILEAAIVSNVSKTAFSWPDDMKGKIHLMQLSAHTPLPFQNRYATPDTLGNDRKALAAAASQQYGNRNVLVIDAGTCITYDIKTDKNEYLGGGISPGLKMRFKALNTFTANLPLIEFKKKFEAIGNTTPGSIVSGVEMGFVCEVDGMIQTYKNQFDDLMIIITGGDAQFLSINLKNSIFANSNFLLEGLNYILEFNNSQ
jgi:type III pantothenate kinase